MSLKIAALFVALMTSPALGADPTAPLPETLPRSATAKIKVAERTRPCEQGCLNPVEAVTFASYLGTRAGVAGEFALPVKAIGLEAGRVFLNSESDYRDRNCLTVVLPLAVAKSLAGSAEPDALRKHFEGKRLIVRGVARQVRIDFTQDGKPTGKYYYQVHLPVRSAAQVMRLPG